ISIWRILLIRICSATLEYADRRNPPIASKAVSERPDFGARKRHWTRRGQVLGFTGARHCVVCGAATAQDWQTAAFPLDSVVENRRDVSRVFGATLCAGGLDA